MKAIFSPGPSYSDPEVRRFAGWVKILDLYKEGLEELGFEIIVPQVDPKLIDKSSTVSKILSYDIVASQQIPEDATMFLGPPGYSIAQMLAGQGANAGLGMYNFLYVWNNADWWRDEQLAEEYKKFGVPYDLSPTWRWINERALKMCDHVIACSPWVKKTHTLVVPSEKISINPWGVDSKRFTPSEKKVPGFRILFVGGDPIRKGLVYLIDALKGIPSDQYELWIAGCHPFADNPFPPNWKQFGMVEADKMPDIMRQCHVICIPTLEDGVALAIQEGMACGLSAVTSPETAEVFEDRVSGIKVGYRDVKAIHEALAMLKENPERRKEMGRQARSLAEEQTWEKTKESFKEIISKEMNL